MNILPNAAPSSLALDVVNGIVGDAKHFSYRLHACHVRMNELSDFYHIPRSQFCGVGIIYRFVRSFFGRHVSRIVQIGAQEKMGWIAARRIIAVMADFQSIWYLSVVYDPRNPMGKMRHFSNPNAPIAKFVSTSKPFPTFRIRFFGEFAKKRVALSLVKIDQCGWFEDCIRSSIHNRIVNVVSDFQELHTFGSRDHFNLPTD